MFGAWEKKAARGETPHTRKTRKLYTERPGIEPANPSTIRQLSNQLTNSEYFLDNKSFRQGLSITYSPILSQIFNYMSTKLFKVPNILRSDLLNTHSAPRSLRSSFLRRLSFLISYLWTKGDRDSCSGISRQLRLFTHWYCCSVWPKYFWLKKKTNKKNYDSQIHFTLRLCLYTCGGTYLTQECLRPCPRPVWDTFLVDLWSLFIVLQAPDSDETLWRTRKQPPPAAPILLLIHWLGLSQLH